MTAAVQYPPSAYTAHSLTPGVRRGGDNVVAPFARQPQAQTREPEEQIIDAEWQTVHETILYPGPSLAATPEKLIFSAEGQRATLSPATAAARYRQMESDASTKKNRTSGQQLDIFI